MDRNDWLWDVFLMEWDREHGDTGFADQVLPVEVCPN